MFSHNWMAGGGLDFYLHIVVELIASEITGEFPKLLQRKTIFFKCETATVCKDYEKVFFSSLLENTLFSFVLFLFHSFLNHCVLIFQSTKGFGIEHNCAFLFICSFYRLF